MLTMLVLFGVWLGTLLLFLIVGSVMSAIAMKQAARPPVERTGEAQRGTAVLRRAYHALLMTSSFYYYLSLPLLLVAVVGAGGLMIYGFFALGRIPVKLVLILVVLIAVTAWAIVKSIFTRPHNGDPGTKIDLGAEPKLRAALDEVAGKIGTRAVDNVYMTPGTDIAVTERGGMRLRGDSERCLILGVAVLDGMTTAQLKAILAHEYGHFSNRDTAGGGLALSVRNGLLVMAHTLAENGAATWYNPAWWFFRGFYSVFLRISQGASRLQEVLADRWSAFSYGSEAFVEGLTHAIRQSIRFDAHVNATLNEVIPNKLALKNLYTYQPSAEVLGDLEEQVQAALNAEPSPYDSHPAPRDRFAWVRALSAPVPASDTTPAWSLFADRDALQAQMTAEVRENIARIHGVSIPG